MKRWWVILLVLAVAAAGWWWWRRRQQQLPPPAYGYPVGGGYAPAPTFPATPANGGITGALVSGAGQLYGEGGRRVCKAYGLPDSVCNHAATLNAKAAEAYVKVHLAAAGYVWDGVKWVGGKVKDGLQAIVPFW